MEQVERLLIEAGLLPQTMPINVTFNKVRGILRELEGSDKDKLLKAIEAAGRLKLRGALASMIFIKHHLEGEHEVELDRIDESEDGARLAVLVYPEGEVPIRCEYLPSRIDAGTRLRYDPSAQRYSQP